MGTEWTPGQCRALRWDGWPVFEGPHGHHMFVYGPQGMYSGHCAGRPFVDSDAVDSPSMDINDRELMERIAVALENIADSLALVEGTIGSNLAGEGFFKVVTGDKS